jgi:FlaA1/EpsC-like NDP-sugar epimerase
MGARVRIVDVAHQLMGLAGTTSPTVYTGLREGEKLHEDLFGSGEADHRPTHPAISEVPVPALPVDDVVRRSVVSSATAMAQISADDESPLTGSVRSLVLKSAGPGRNAAGSGQP